MNRKYNPFCFVALAMATFLGSPQSVLGVLIDFESVPLGTTYGTAAGDLPGEVVLSQEGVAMSVQNFLLGSYVGFVRAEVGGEFDPFFPTTPLGLENISVMFDVSGMAQPVTSVTLDYVEFGGFNNLSVNGGTLFQVDSFTDLPPVVAPGVTVSVTADQIILTGLINRFVIGGQELGIDNTNAVPEPGTLALGIAAVLTLGRMRRRRAA